MQKWENWGLDHVCADLLIFFKLQASLQEFFAIALHII